MIHALHRKERADRAPPNKEERPKESTRAPGTREPEGLAQKPIIIIIIITTIIIIIIIAGIDTTSPKDCKYRETWMCP